MNALALLLLVLMVGAPASPVAAAARHQVASSLEVAAHALPEEARARIVERTGILRLRECRVAPVPRWRCPAGRAWPAPRAPTAG